MGESASGLGSLPHPGGALFSRTLVPRGLEGVTCSRACARAATVPIPALHQLESGLRLHWGGGGWCRQRRATAGRPCPLCQSLGTAGPQRPSQDPWDSKRVEARELPT